MPLRSLLLILLLVGPRYAAAQAAPRYLARFADGSRLEGDQLADWHQTEAQPKLNGQPLLAPEKPLRWLIDRSLPLPRRPEQFVETFTGDCVPGAVTGFRDADDAPFVRSPAHFLVRPPAADATPAPLPSTDAWRVAARWVRRIVWQRRASSYQPGTLLLRAGGQIAFRVARFSDGYVSLLTEEGPRRVAFRQIAEIHLAGDDPWEAYLDELALLTPDGQSRLLQLETRGGLVATTSLARFLARPGGDVKLVERWLHGIQPAWSLDVLWIANGDVRVRRLFAPHEVPLCRLFPTAAHHRSPWGGSYWPPRVNYNVRGGPLRSGDGEFAWGYGVHAESELRFDLTPLASSFRATVGLDRIVGPGGCIRARLLQAPGDQVLYQSPFLAGSAAAADTGDVRLQVPQDDRQHELVLLVDAAHDGRPAGADPFDIRDVADWCDPLLQLDPTRLQQQLDARRTRQLPAWDGWQVSIDEHVRLTRVNLATDIEPTGGPFAHAVAVADGPLVISQRRALTADDHWLVVNATRAQNVTPPPQLEVRIGGERVAQLDVPLRDRGHPDLHPPALDLAHFQREAAPAVEIEVRQLPHPEGVPVEWHAVGVSRQHPALFCLFEDDPPGGDTPAADDLRRRLDGDQRHAGQRSLKLAAGDRARLQPPRPLAVRERPGPGECRFLRFALRKQGGGRVQLELHRTVAAELPALYDAGPEPLDESPAKRVWTQELPEEWIVITRDLFGDFGEFDLESAALIAAEGGDAWFDHVYLARTQNDFALAAPAPPPEETNRQARRELAKPILDKAGPACVALRFADGRVVTGIIVTAAGEVLTAGHAVVRPDQDVQVQLADGRLLPARTRGVCRDADLGLVQIAEEGQYPFIAVNPAPAVPPNLLYVGFAHTRSAADPPTPAAAHIVGIRQVLGGQVWTDFELDDFSTGGPLVDKDGRVIGVHSRRSHFGGFYYTQLTDWAALLPRLQAGEVWGNWPAGSGPMVGVEITNTPRGCQVTDVFADSPAAAAGMAVGDVITKIDGRPVLRLDHVYALLAAKDPGQSVGVEYRRGEQNGNVGLTLAPRVP